MRVLCVSFSSATKADSFFCRNMVSCSRRRDTMNKKLTEEEILANAKAMDAQIREMWNRQREQREMSGSMKQIIALDKARKERQRLEYEEYLQTCKRRDMESNSIPYFMKEAACLRFDPKERTPSAMLYEAYCRWCEGEKLFPESIRSFGLHLKKNATKYQIAPTNFIWQGRHIRGFRGILLMEDREHTSHT